MSHDRILIKGNEAVAFGALDAGCRCYFGYPITPQNEIPETMSLRLPECGGQFVQAESEVAAINMLLGDAIVAQIKEPVRRQPPADALSPEALAELAAPWRMEGYGKRGPGAKPRLLKSVYLAEGALAARNRLLMEKYAAMQAEACAECWNTDDAELVVVAFGSMARIARSAIRKLREEGLKAGLFRPKTLYPFPADALRALAPGRRFLVIEQNTGQMVEDVRLSLMGENAKVDWHGVMPGLFIGADALEDPIRQACKEN